MFAGKPDAVDEGAVVFRGHGNGRLSALVVDAEEAFGEDDDAVARDVVLL